MKRLFAMARNLSPRMRRVLIACAGVVVVLDAGKVAHRRMSFGGDFDISREFGRRFLEGEYLYAHGLHYVYLPSAAMYFSPLALVPPAVAFSVWFVIALACLVLTLRLWQRMSAVHRGAVAQHGFIIGLITAFLASHFLIRDFDDGGPHTILLAFLSAGIYAAFRQRKAAAALWLGLATAIKVTPGLFVPFLMWKREWRLAVYTAVASVFWIALPSVWMGPAAWSGDMKDWVISAAGFAVGTNNVRALGPRKVIHNQSFHAAVLYLVKQSGMTPQLANGVAVGATIAIVVLFCWMTRHRYVSLASAAWPYEASMLMVLSVLLSPITWEQHMVFLVPALYLITAEAVTEPGLNNGILALMVAFVLVSLVITRDLLDKDRFLVLLGYHIQTLSMLIVLTVAVLRHRAASRADSPRAP